MNEHRGARRARGAWNALILAGASVFTGARSNPLGVHDSDYGPRTPVERLRTIATLKLDDYALPKTDDETPMEPPRDPYAGMERFELSLERARVWTLTNNLDLQVALVEPTIQREGLHGEENKFESIFTARITYSEFNQPIASSLDDNEADQLNITPGLRIPLVTGGTVRLEAPIEYFQTNNEFSQPEQYENDIAFSIVQPLLRNAGRRTNTYSIRIQALETQIAEARAKLEVIRQLASVDRAYWRLYAARRLLEVRQEQYRLAQTQLEQAQRRVRAQVAPEVEIIRAQSGVAERLDGIIRADNAVRDLQRELKRIMNEPGLDINTPILLELSSAPDPVEYEIDASRFADAALANRMEMLELELRLAQDLSTIDFQKNQALPLFSVDYRYNINGLGESFGASNETLRGLDFADWTIGGTFEVPLGNEPAEARVHQAILRRLQRLSTKEARELAIRQEVYSAVDQIEAAWQRILATRRATILAVRTLRAEQNQFDVGARTSTDVLDAATRLADAQSLEIAAVTDYQVSHVDLAFATGTLLGASKVDWAPRDPRQPIDFVGEKRGRVPLGPPGNLPDAIDPAKTQPLPPAPIPPSMNPPPEESVIPDQPGEHDR